MVWESRWRRRSAGTGEDPVDVVVSDDDMPGLGNDTNSDQGEIPAIVTDVQHERMDILVDSGAGCNALPRKVAQGVALGPLPADAQKSYTTASGNTVVAEGNEEVPRELHHQKSAGDAVHLDGRAEADRRGVEDREAGPLRLVPA